MTVKELEKITKSLSGVCRIVNRYGLLVDILKPGVLKKLVVASHFGHKPVFDRSFEAHDEKYKYSYFTAWERNRFQTGMVGEEYVSSTEADFFCFVVFDAKDQVKILRTYTVSKDVFLNEARRQISGKKKANVSVSEKWARNNS